MINTGTVSKCRRWYTDRKFPAKVIISVPANNVFDSTGSLVTRVSQMSSKYSRLDLPVLISFVEVRGSFAVYPRDAPRKREFNNQA